MRMMKKIKKIVSIILIFVICMPTFSAFSDGSMFVTKAEFDSTLADFNSRLTTFEAGINSKIDSQVTTYLDRNGIWNGREQDIGVVGTRGVWLTNSDFPGYGAHDMNGKTVWERYAPNSTATSYTWDELQKRIQPYSVDITSASTMYSIKLTSSGNSVTKDFVKTIDKSGLFTCLLLFRNDWNTTVDVVESTANGIKYIPGDTSGHQWSDQLADVPVDDLTISKIMSTNPTGNRSYMYNTVVNTLTANHAIGHYTAAVAEEIKIVDQHGNIKFLETVFEVPYKFDMYRDIASIADWFAFFVQDFSFSPYLYLPKFFVSSGDELKIVVTLYARGRDTNENLYLGGSKTGTTNLYCYKVEEAKVY